MKIYLLLILISIIAGFSNVPGRGRAKPASDDPRESVPV